MLIDWFTVIAQVINFLILVWLLKRFLYKPILQAIDEREEKIAAKLEEAENARTEAVRERDQYRERNEAFAQERESSIDEMNEEIKAKKQALLEEAREEYEQRRAKLKDAWDDEQADMSREIIRQTRKEVFEIARKVLADLADTTLEEQMVAVFIRQLRKLDGEELEQLRSAMERSRQPLKVRNVFGWTSEQKKAIEKAVRELLDAEVQMRFEKAPEEAGGIDCSVSGYQLAWTIDSYLDALEARLDGLLEGTPPQKQTAGQEQEST